MRKTGGFSGKRRISTLGALGALLGWAASAEAGPRLTFEEGKRSLEILQAYQLWGAVTPDPQVVTAPNAEGETVPDPRADLYFRRARLGLRGLAYTNLEYLIWFAYDNLGKDPYTATLGSGQPLANNTFQPWDAFLTYRLDSTWANITAGLFRPHLGREFVISYTGILGLEKNLNHYYLRNHVTQRPSGRETGVNIGGQFNDTTRGYGFNYNVGAFDATQERGTASTALNGALSQAPLFAGRLGFTLGQPENKDYKISYDVNYFGARKGLSLAAFGSYQGAVDERFTVDSGQVTNRTLIYNGGFKANSSLGGDLLVNWAGWTVGAEYALLQRTFGDVFRSRWRQRATDTATIRSRFARSGMPRELRDFRDRVYSVYAGYSIPIGETQFLEPSALFSRFEGDPDGGSPVYNLGEDQVIDLGVNWYVKKNTLKLSLHYLMQEGGPVSLFASQRPSATGETQTRSDVAVLALQLNY